MYKIWQGIVNTLLGLSISTPKTTYVKRGWKQETLSMRCGTYQSGEGVKLELFLQEDELMCQIEGKVYRVIPVTDHVGVINIRGENKELWFYEQNQEPWAVGFGGRIIYKTESLV